MKDINSEALSIEKAYHARIEEYERQVHVITMDTAQRLRELMVPALHRWGIGVKCGLTWLYPHELTVYECIAKVEDSNYLLLIISGKGLEAALVPQYTQ